MLSFVLAAKRIAGRGMGHDDDLGRDHRQKTRGIVQAGDLVRLRSSWPVWVPAGPLADRRVKCTETPGGASCVISGSTVGLPGGTRNPIRARHPIIACDLR